jgi:hypothetical protein
MRISIQCMCRGKTAESSRFHSTFNKTLLKQHCRSGTRAIPSILAHEVGDRGGFICNQCCRSRAISIEASLLRDHLSPILWALKSSLNRSRGSASLHPWLYAIAPFRGSRSALGPGLDRLRGLRSNRLRPTRRIDYIPSRTCE